MTKKELRNIYREKRNQLGSAEKAKLDDLLLIQFQKAQLPFINFLLSYWPIEENGESNTHLFTDYLEFKNPGLLVAYPKTDFFMDEMVAVTTDAETNFLKNEYHIYEPEEGNRLAAGEIDMVLVPLLAFDNKGCRVGYGKGFYDKFLAETRKDCIKVGFSYFEPVDEISDKADFDVPLNLCMTPQSVYVF
ncbi:MAG: 5-formyltetrahydrofolate cyclo-ligase [Bacteroidota bacterium]|nr:5-formyltetrahydrofolate cyclo-ligase [Bacteroidota bacterium]